MSLSLVAVFIPILMMGGIIGRLFREFAVVLSVTILVSLVVSLTTTPMMCSLLLEHGAKHGRFYMASERIFERILKGYENSLHWMLDRSLFVLIVAVATIGLKRLPVHHHTEGLLPAAGHRAPERQRDRRSGDILSSDAGQNSNLGGHRQVGPRRGDGHRLHGRRRRHHHQYRKVLHRAQAA
jgi:uncharacterized membrane protein YdfJ with MMPL/SSD domain